MARVCVGPWKGNAAWGVREGIRQPHVGGVCTGGMPEQSPEREGDPANRVGRRVASRRSFAAVSGAVNRRSRYGASTSA